jgi:hypothetical protein
MTISGGALATAFLILLGFAVAFALLARRIEVPYPVVLLIGGLAVSLVPGTPRFRLDPNFVFYIVLPPLLYSAAWTTSWRDFSHQLVSIPLAGLRPGHLHDRRRGGRRARAVPRVRLDRGRDPRRRGGADRSDRGRRDLLAARPAAAAGRRDRRRKPESTTRPRWSPSSSPPCWRSPAPTRASMSACSVCSTSPEPRWPSVRRSPSPSTGWSAASTMGRSRSRSR